MKQRILYVHQYFKTYDSGGAMRSFFVAKALVEAGFEVEVITTHNEKKYTFQQIDGINVHYLPVFYKNELSFLRRIIAFLLFVWKSFWLAKKLPPAQLIIATSTPLTVGIIALVLKKSYKIPYIFEVRDIWPQIPIAMGILKNPLLQKIAFFLELTTYKQAQELIALSPAIQNHIQAKVPEKKVAMIPNMADTNFFKITTNSNFYKQKLGLPQKTLIGYFGTVSQANHLEYFWEMANLFAQNQETEVHFIVMGSGKGLPSLIDKKTDNISIFEPVNKFILKDWLQAVEFVYVSFLNIPILASGSPNKFFDGLAAGKVCLVNFEGWMKALIEENQCGLYLPPNDPVLSFLKLKTFLQNPSLLQTYQKNARQLAETTFSREKLCADYVALLKKQFSPTKNS